MNVHLNLPLTILTACLLAGRFFVCQTPRFIKANTGKSRQHRTPLQTPRFTAEPKHQSALSSGGGDRGTRWAPDRRAPAPLLSLWIRRRWGFAKVTAANIYMPRLAALWRRESAVKQAGCSSVTSQALQAGSDVGLLRFLVSLKTSLIRSCCSCLHLPCSILVSVQHHKPESLAWINKVEGHNYIETFTMSVF